jgi:hypothetical protein
MDETVAPRQGSGVVARVTDDRGFFEGVRRIEIFNEVEMWGTGRPSAIRAFEPRCDVMDQR